MLLSVGLVSSPASSAGFFVLRPLLHGARSTAVAVVREAEESEIVQQQQGGESKEEEIQITRSCSRIRLLPSLAANNLQEFAVC